MTTRSDHRRPTRDRSRADLGVAYGLIGGAAIGSVLMALTGDDVWIRIGPGLGLPVGLLVAALLARGAGEDEDPAGP